MRVVGVLLFLQSILFWGYAFADENEFRIREAQQAARISALTADRVLYSANQALDAAARIMSTVENDRLIHEELKRLASGIPGARAIIVIDDDGALLHDSYRFPVARLDLSDRQYFKDASRSNGLVVGTMVVGRTSGLSFIPIAKRSGPYTIAAIAGAYSLVDIETACADCWAGMVRTDGELVSLFPPEGQFSQSLYDMIAHETADTGYTVLKQHKSVIAVSWSRSPNFPIVSFGIRGIPDTANVGINFN